MNSGIHLGYAWLLGDSAGFDLPGRRAIAIAGVAADLDGAVIVLGRETFNTYHHVIFHNFLFAGAITLAILILFPRKPKLILFSALAALLHLGIDFAGSHWDLQLFRPFSSASINLTDYFPKWVVIYLLQGIGTILMFALMFRVFIKKERSFFEVFTTRGDKLIMRFLTLPWRHRCETCGKRAFYRCSECNKDVCSRHWKSGKGWRLLCEECFGIDKASADQVTETGTNGE